MPQLKPRKHPRQARSKATVDAILEACARLLRSGDYAAVTTNHIAELAGVSIGTLYEFFPSKESIVAALTERHLTRLVTEVSEGLEVALGLEERKAAELLIRRIVDAVSSDRELYKVLLRQAPFLQRLPAARQATAALFDLGRMAGERARRRVNLPNLEADTWLIGHMVQSAVLEIAFLEEGTMDRRLLTDELVRLTFRMIQGRDPTGFRAAPSLQSRRASRSLR
jgi:AcrR family transcriptional regulator